MGLEPAVALLGVFVGLLVGSLGVGGGAITTPTLILLGVAPINAVGTDLLFVLPSKLFATLLYHRRGEVDVTSTKKLLMGGIPAIILSYILLVTYMRGVGIEGVNNAIRLLLGVLLIAVSFTHLAKIVLEKEAAKHHNLPPLSLELVGFIASALLFFTSVGSGVIVMAVLLHLFSSSPRKAVGTTLAYSLTVTSITTVFYAGLGAIDLRLTAILLLTGLPGIYLGFKAIKAVPRKPLIAMVAVSILLLGSSLLFLGG